LSSAALHRLRVSNLCPETVCAAAVRPPEPALRRIPVFPQRPRRDNLPMRAVASAEFSPQSCARIGGILYLLIIAAGLFAQAFVRDRLVVPGDAAVTAINIKGHAFLLRVANSAAVILSPRLASMLFPPVLVPAFIGELSFAVWLTVKGVNVAKWQEMAERSRR
jgi:hypothetical protein